MVNSLTNQTVMMITILAVLTVTGPTLFSLPAQQVHAQSNKTTTTAATTAEPSTSNQTSTSSEEEEHEGGENLFVSQHIPLTGSLLSGDYILLMDFTPFMISPEGHSHIAMKVPCNESGGPEVTIVTGVAPNLTTLDMGSAISNGTLNGNSLDLSDEGTSCLYHAAIPSNITDIALVNTSGETLDFDEGGYSVTVSAHAIVGEHEEEGADHQHS
jgi:hypothetical protein